MPHAPEFFFVVIVADVTVTQAFGLVSCAISTKRSTMLKQNESDGALRCFKP